jgi:alpha-tubulin suppressor-like RCC1 family protein
MYSMTTGSDSEIIRVNASDGDYIVNWHTDHFALDTLLTYRISVLIGASVVGYADVDVVSGGNEVKNVQTGDFIALVDGRTLPIKFRMDVGMVVSVVVSPSLDTLSIGSGVQLLATAVDAHGSPISGHPVTWQSSANSIATVDISGQVTGIVAGDATISATIDAMIGTAQVVVRGTSYAAIEAAATYTCATTVDHRAYCWGANGAGMLGIGASDDVKHPAPLLVVGDHAFTTVSNDNAHSCALDLEGAAYCWGYGSDTRLGTGIDAGSPSPVQVAGGHSFTQIDVGYNHACAVATDQQAYCWGYGMLGDLGNTDNPAARGNGTVPTLVIGGLHFAQVASGNNFTCGLTTSESTYCWGLDTAGQLGSPAPTTYNCDPYACSLSPMAIAGAPDFVQISAGDSHACGITADGVAYCWGSNSNGQLGDGTHTNHTTPSEVASLPGVTEISAGWFYTCALTRAGSIYCWGFNQYGELGNGTTSDSSLPIQISAPGIVFRTVSAGFTHACAISTAGTAYCWGYNTDGELGNGTLVESHSPVQVLDPQ